MPLDPAETAGNHGALWVDTDGRSVKLEPIEFGLCRFVTVSFDLTGVGDSSQLEDELRTRVSAVEAADRALVACRLHGRRAASLRVDAGLLAQQLAGDALGVSVADASDPEIDLTELAREPNARGRALSTLLSSQTPGAPEAAGLLAEAFESDLRLPV